MRMAECGLRPLRAVGSPSCLLYEPEAVGAIEAYAPEGMRNGKAKGRSQRAEVGDQRSMGRGRIETIEGEIVKQGTWGGDAGSRQTGDTQIGYHPKVQTARKRSA